jgi:hypothetical protein
MLDGLHFSRLPVEVRTAEIGYGERIAR